MATMYGFFPMTSSPSPDDSDHSVSTACSLSATQPERRNTMQPCRRSFPDVGPARVCPPCCVRPTTCFLSALEGFARVVDYEPRSFTLGSVSSVLLGLLPCACFSAPHLPGRRSALGDGSPTLVHGPSTLTLPLPSHVLLRQSVTSVYHRPHAAPFLRPSTISIGQAHAAPLSLPLRTPLLPGRVPRKCGRSRARGVRGMSPRGGRTRAARPAVAGPRGVGAAG
jgi:hypothetical protein